MTATINYIAINGDEEIGENIDSQKITLNFKIESVDAYYVIDEGEDSKYIWISFGGQEYPLIYEEVLEMALEAHFNPTKSDLAA